MTAKMPPVPPAERSDKGPGSAPKAPKETSFHNPPPKGSRVPENPDQQGQTGNTRINTTNQGYQQDR